MVALNSYIIVFAIPVAIAICGMIWKEEEVIRFENKLRDWFRAKIKKAAR